MLTEMQKVLISCPDCNVMRWHGCLASSSRRQRGGRGRGLSDKMGGKMLKRGNKDNTELFGMLQHVRSWCGL